MRGWHILPLAFALAGAAVPAVRGAGEPHLPTALPAFLTSAPVQGNCGDCNTFSFECAFPWHQVVPFEEFGIGYVGLHSSCEFGFCSNHHGTCQDTFASTRDAARVYAAVRAAPGHLVEQVVSSLGPNVHLNRERNSVQMDGCGGTIAVNIPLSESQVAALESRN